MNALTRRYLFGLIFIGVAIFQLTINDYLEFSLYLLAGLAFIFNSLVSEPRLAAYRNVLVIVTWSLIIAAGILFLYLVQYRWF